MKSSSLLTFGVTCLFSPSLVFSDQEKPEPWQRVKETCSSLWHNEAVLRRGVVSLGTLLLLSHQRSRSLSSQLALKESQLKEALAKGGKTSRWRALLGGALVFSLVGNAFYYFKTRRLAKKAKYATQAAQMLEMERTPTKVKDTRSWNGNFLPFPSPAPLKGYVIPSARPLKPNTYQPYPSMLDLFSDPMAIDVSVYGTRSYPNGLSLKSDFRKALRIPDGGNGIRKVTLCPQIVAIKEEAFADFRDLEDVFQQHESLDESAPPTFSLRSVGARAFLNCWNLPKISLPHVNDIQESAFSGCQRLKEVQLPENAIEAIIKGRRISYKKPPEGTYVVKCLFSPTAFEPDVKVFVGKYKCGTWEQLQQSSEEALLRIQSILQRPDTVGDVESTIAQILAEEDRERRLELGEYSEYYSDDSAYSSTTPSPQKKPTPPSILLLSLNEELLEP